MLFRSNGLFIGIVASLIASLITFLVTLEKTKKKYKRKFGRLEGDYYGYGYSSEDQDLILNSEPQSLAKIRYLKDNLLQFELKENSPSPNYSWSGTIVMELDNFGSIAWKYDIYNGEKLGQEKHKFGFKRLIVNETKSSFCIYLMEENLIAGEKYKREVLTKNNISCS